MRWWILSASSVAAFTALALLVHDNITDGFDAMIFQLARPGDVWGPAQYRASVMVDVLRPSVVGTILVGFTVLQCVRRRSARPAVLVAGAMTVTCVLTVAAKTLVSRTDPHGWVSTHGGSFPSGHTAVLVVGLGLAVQLTRRATRLQGILIMLSGVALMGACLVLAGTHWATDVLGGAVLAVGILAAACGVRAVGATRSIPANVRRPTR